MPLAALVNLVYQTDFNGFKAVPLQYCKQQAHSLYSFRFPLPSVRDQRCAGLIVASLLSRTLRRIPQAVSTVATRPKFNATTIHFYGIVSIPQAVSTFSLFFSFSLWSGTRDVQTSSSLHSSAGTLRCIQQAVSTVATVKITKIFISDMMSCNTASGKYCCNTDNNFERKEYKVNVFQYRKR